MMITLQSQIVYLLLLSNAALLTIACFLMARFERRSKQIEAFWESPTGAALVCESKETASEQSRISQELNARVGELDKAVKVLQVRAAKPSGPLEPGLPIENAFRMAKLGASIDDLTKSCGLNIGEARLMQRLHGKAQVLSGVG